MVVTSVIAALMLSGMLYGRVPFPALVVLFAVIVAGSAFLACRGHVHRHDLMGLDTLAHASKLGRWNAGLKTCACVVMVAGCVAANSLLVAGVLLAGMSAVSLWSSRLTFSRYCSLLAVPVLFVSLSGIVLLVEVSSEPFGVLSVPVFGWNLCVTEESQAMTLMVVAKAAGSLACLYALALSTPIYEIAGFLRRAHVPAVVVDLMVLIYRYVSVLVGSLQRMTTAAQARLGEHGYRAMWRSFAGVASNLLVRSFFRASRSFDAMEARGYVDELNFDVKEQPLVFAHAFAVVACMAFVVAVFAFERMCL